MHVAIDLVKDVAEYGGLKLEHWFRVDKIGLKHVFVQTKLGHTYRMVTSDMAYKISTKCIQVQLRYIYDIKSTQFVYFVVILWMCSKIFLVVPQG